jgi:ATP-dependent Zn protease
MKMIESTAFHEAGHAVLAHYLGVGLRLVTIDADEDSAGHIQDGGEWSEEAEELRILADEAYWLRMAISRYAGAEAVRRYAPRTKWKEGAGNDHYWAAIAIEKITADPRSVRALHAYAQRQARLLVEHYWPEIQRLARALMKEKTLSGDDAKKLITESHVARRGRICMHI